MHGAENRRHHYASYNIVSLYCEPSCGLEYTAVADSHYLLVWNIGKTIHVRAGFLCLRILGVKPGTCGPRSRPIPLDTLLPLIGA